MKLSRGWWTLFVVSALASGCDCSGDVGVPDGGDVGSADARPPSDAPRMDGGGDCGDFEINGDEECDDGNDVAGDGCAADCTLECGDGAVSGDELCDTGIAVGETGACPITCDDGEPCTSDSLDGSDCSTTCSNAPISAAADDDMCCPDGETAATDNDCAGSCGDGVVTGDELCDTAIADGVGSCPSDCDDGMSCTADELTGEGTCDAVCSNSAITDPADGDGCCPDGATTATDDDCLPGCGNGVVDAGEACDTAIASGSGSCPTACNDGMACTRDVLDGADSCSATCRTTPITMAMGGDGCCPTGATIGTDSDCAARCGDRAITPPETCDDGNTASGDGCSATCRTEAAAITAFRITDLDIEDPHLWAQILFCLDITDSAFGMDGVNPLLQNAIRADGDDPADGTLDLSIVQVFSPLAQGAASMPMTRVTFPDCTTPYTNTMCTLASDGDRTTTVTATNLASGTCLGARTGTTRYTFPVPTAPTGGTCYSATAGTIAIDLGGIPVVLTDASIGGEYFGTPATEIRDGLIVGFMSYTQAAATIIPEGTTGQDAIDGSSLASLMRTRSTGGATPGACGSSMSASDLDVGSDGTTPGWWFYMSFQAAIPTSYTEE